MVGENVMPLTGWAYWTNSDTITAYSTLALCVVTSLLVAATWLYVREVRNQATDIKNHAANLKRQADAMEAQSNFIRGQSEAMTRQADTMENQFQIIREESATMIRQANTIEGQSNTMLEQSIAMKKQADAMEKQSSLMLKSMEYDRFLKKYERLREEMDKLVAPLYFAALSFNEKSPGFFALLNPDKRWDLYFHDRILFWDEIKKNTYLIQSDKLLELLIKYFQYNDAFFENQSEGARSNFEKNRRELIYEIKEVRYPKLKKEIEGLEKQLIMADKIKI